MKNNGTTIDRFKKFFGDTKYPCVMAKSAVHQNSIQFVNCITMQSAIGCGHLYQSLKDYSEDDASDSPYRSLVAIFEEERLDLSELEFETKLWHFLTNLHGVDELRWDTQVSQDPKKSTFSFSVYGHAFYIVGLHPHSSRLSRRAPFPALVFNLHSQFDKLRDLKVFKQLRDQIRKRDTNLQGFHNPMVADFGKLSEARQYSGRQVGADWKCPFK